MSRRALPAGDRALWATALYGGLRRGELQALRWQDVDLDGSVDAPVERRAHLSVHVLGNGGDVAIETLRETAPPFGF